MWSNGSRNDTGNVTLNCLVWYFVPTWKNLMCYCSWHTKIWGKVNK